MFNLYFFFICENITKWGGGGVIMPVANLQNDEVYLVWVFIHFFGLYDIYVTTEIFFKIIISIIMRFSYEPEYVKGNINACSFFMRQGNNIYMKKKNII